MFNVMDQMGHVSAARRFATFLASIIAHTIALLALVILPLIFVGAIPTVQLISYLIAAPEPPPAKIPPIPPAWQPETKAVPPVKEERFEIPPRIPIGIPLPPTEEPSSGHSSGTIQGVAGGPPVGAPMGVLGSPLGSAVFALSAPTPLQSPPPPPAQKKDPVRRGGDVQESKLIKKIDPIYPRLAVITRISGVVILDVRVDEEGNVESIRVLQGHPWLSEAAVSAVRQWKYSPTILNGEPVPVVATVTVVFNLR